LKILASALLVFLSVPAALANSVSLLNSPSKPPFIVYQIPSGGTAVLEQIQGPQNLLWELKGGTSGALFSFSFDFDHTHSPVDFYEYGPLSFTENGVTYGGTIIQAHINSAGVLSGGWTAPSNGQRGYNHGRFEIQLYYNGTGCSGSGTSVQCLNLGTGTFSVATTPEPGSLGLMATGLIAVAAAARRKISKIL
jgi:hypothetical protein